MKPELREMEDCVCFNLRCASRAITRFYAGAVTDTPLTPTQSPILGGLAAHPEGLTMAQLSDWLEMDRTSLLRTLRPLEKAGFIESGLDGARKVLRITPEGRKVLEKMFRSWQAAQRRAIKTLGAARWREIVRDLEKAAAELNR